MAHDKPRLFMSPTVIEHSQLAKNRDLGDLARITKGGTWKGPQRERPATYAGLFVQVSSSVLYGLHYTLIRAIYPL